MTEQGENRCEYCLAWHPGRPVRWCNEVCAAQWMHSFYWPTWQTVLAQVLEANPDADPREIHAITDERTGWIAGGPPPTACGKLHEYLGKKSAQRPMSNMLVSGKRPEPQE